VTQKINENAYMVDIHDYQADGALSRWELGIKFFKGGGDSRKKASHIEDEVARKRNNANLPFGLSWRPKIGFYYILARFDFTIF
jgi:hypothetical protein